MDRAKRIGENLRSLRKSAGLNQRELGEALGYSTKAVSKWESGAGLPPTAILPDLARALRTDVNALLDLRTAPEYYLGIDGGGTKTEFKLVDSKGEAAGEKRIALSACNPTSVGLAECLRILTEGATRICAGIEPGLVSVHAGIAGAGVGGNAGAIRTELEKLGFAAVGVSNDAYNAVYAGLGKGDGVAVIIGTGSVVYSAAGGVRRKLGGWGHLVGDPMSGSGLGRAALETVLRELSGCGVSTALKEILEPGDRTPERIIERLYAEGKSFPASLAPGFFDCVRAGDAEAKRILEEDLERLAELIRSALRDQRDPKTAPVVLFGGICAHRDVFLERLKKLTGAGDLRIAQRSPVEGALIQAGAEVIK